MLLRIRNSIFTKMACYLLSMMTIVTSCTTSKNEVSKNYSGQELFEGILFGEGEVGDKLPEIKSKITEKLLTLSDEQKQELGVTKRKLIAEVLKQNPLFFDQFKQKIDSKDYLAIDKALVEASNMLLDASYNTNLELKSKITKEDFIKSMQAKAKGARVSSEAGSVWVVQTDVAVGLYVVIAVALLWIVVIPYQIPPPNPINPNAKQGLPNEMLINSIVNNL